MNKRILSILTGTALLGLAAAAPVQAVPSYFAGTGNYYEFVNANVSWQTARNNAAASTLGVSTGHLVTIMSQAENDFVFNLITPSTRDTWIGATDEAIEGQWRWVTGELFYVGQNQPNNTALIYSNWQPGGTEPNNSGDEDYAHFRGFNGWNDLDPGTGMAYVVEYENVVPAPATGLLMGLGLSALALLRRRRAKAA